MFRQWSTQNYYYYYRIHDLYSTKNLSRGWQYSREAGQLQYNKLGPCPAHKSFQSGLIVVLLKTRLFQKRLKTQELWKDEHIKWSWWVSGEWSFSKRHLGVEGVWVQPRALGMHPDCWGLVGQLSHNHLHRVQSPNTRIRNAETELDSRHFLDDNRVSRNAFRDGTVPSSARLDKRCGFLLEL